MANHKGSLSEMSRLCWSFGQFWRICSPSSDAAHEEDLNMIGLFPEFSMIWLARAALRPARRSTDALLAPFRTLHEIQWSAPWDKAGQHCKEGYG
jgi:hypothetical protein